MAAIVDQSRWSEWVEEARSADILSVVRSFGARLKKAGTAQWVGPCPACGGTDRFSLNVKKRVFNCRGCGGKGDVISFVELVAGSSFIEAVERINGAPRPDRSRDETLEERNARLAKNAARLAKFQQREEDERVAEAAKAKRDEEAIAAVLDRAVPLGGTPGEDYLRGRGLNPHKRLIGDIRFVPDLDYWEPRGNCAGKPVLLATLPAIIAVIRDPDGKVIGLSRTYLDPHEPRKWTPTGSPENSARKILGEKKGGLIRLGRIREKLATGEGWESVLSWHQLGHGPEDLAIAAGIDLDNLAALNLPEGVRAISIAADNDSEPRTLNAKLLTAVNRFLGQGVEVSIHWPPPGSDWNNVLLHETEGTPLSEDTKATEDTNKFRHPGGRETGQEFLTRTEPLFSQRRLESSWPERKLIVAELKPVPAFDANTLLPDPLRSWIIDEAERMPCPPDFIAAAAIVALASIIGARCAIKPKSLDPWLVVPNLWGGAVGDPSEKKSPALTVALKPMDRLIGNAQEEYNAALRSYEAEETVFEAQQAALENRIKDAARNAKRGDPKTIVKELQAHKDQAPHEPTARRYKTNDGTAEKLGELLRDNPNGLLVQRDELVGLLATWDREGREGERAFFQEAWNGNQSFDVDRIGRGHIHVPNLCLSVFGGIQPDKLTTYLEQAVHSLANDGMLQRFQMLVYPNSRRWEWRNKPPDVQARDTAFSVFELLSDLDPVKWGADPADQVCKFPHFRFNDKAQRVFIEWSEDLHQERIPKEDDPIIRQHLSKYDKLFPALALIFHLVDCAARDVGGPVTMEAALRAAAWCEFLEGHARRCYGLLKDDGLRAAQALAKKLEHGALLDGFTARDVRRNQWRNLKTDEAVQSALDWLEDEGWIRGEAKGGTGPGTGRPTTRYRIHPELRSDAGKAAA